MNHYHTYVYASLDNYTSTSSLFMLNSGFKLGN